MKTHQKTVSVFSVRNCFLFALCSAVIASLIYTLKFGDELTLKMFDILAFVISIVSVYAALLGVSGFMLSLKRYSYDTTHINVLYGSKVRQKLMYSEFDGVIISNAGLYEGVGSGYHWVTLSYKSKGTNGTIKTVYPYITLRKPGWPRVKMKSGMNSHLLSCNPNCVNLGICWFDSFSELLEHTHVSVYVLEDVYLRFKGMFDPIFKQHEIELDRFYIVTDHEIAYANYVVGEIE